jgi:hypothetical protein
MRLHLTLLPPRRRRRRLGISSSPQPRVATQALNCPGSVKLDISSLRREIHVTFGPIIASLLGGYTKLGSTSVRSMSPDSPTSITDAWDSGKSVAGLPRCIRTWLPALWISLGQQDI